MAQGFEEHPDVRLLRIALERLRLGELTKAEQDEWDLWEKFHQLKEGGTCH